MRSELRFSYWVDMAAVIVSSSNLVTLIVVVVQCAYVFAVGGIRDTTLGGGMMLMCASGTNTSEAGARRERVCRSLW